jgi:radical SAM superfamily enzyme YgiQ (UPF0313 family)
MGLHGRKSVYLLQQGVWDMPLESMPLASGYLKATALADERLRERLDITIRNYRGGVTAATIANDLFSGPCPDVLACSVLGWNFRTFGSLTETFRQLNPEGWVVFGGTHVAQQADRVFRMFPEVDVVVNGEGELVFRDLLRAFLDGTSRHALGAIAGISYRNLAGEVSTTPPRERMQDLDVIPSPFLTGAIDLLDDAGRFRYDVALMETNRGCPYKCSFCYWGGAVGQRVRAFSRERLRQELELFAKLKVHTIVLCDANFGLLPIDEEFVDDLILARERFGYPRALETSWAKNKSKVFYTIVRKMKQAGLRSSFTLALQTLNDDALRLMNRRNMKVNEWEDLAAWLDAEGLDCYAELIWGAPGETPESFMEGYDRLARRVSRIAVYPILLLPNTTYAEKKREFSIVSVRGDHDDFEYVLSHQTMSFAENQRMSRFMFWARVVAEHAVLRHVWVGLRELAGIRQSQVLSNLDAWIERTEDAAAGPLGAILRDSSSSRTAIGDAIGYLYGDREAKRLLQRWWSDSVRPLLPAELVPVLDEIFRYDLLTQPIYRHEDAAAPVENLPTVRLLGEEYYLRAGVRLDFDVVGIIAALRAGAEPDLEPRPTIVDLCYRKGFEDLANHEVIVHFTGVTREQIAGISAANGSDGQTPPSDDPSRALALVRDRGGCA